MNAFLAGIGGALLVGVMIFLAAVLSTAFGYFGGFVVGWAFDETTFKALEYFNLMEFELKEIGAVLGFTTSFIRSTKTVNNK